MRVSRHSITFRLTLLVLVITTLVLAAVLGYGYFFSREIITKQAEENSRALGREVANHVAAQIKPLEQAAKDIALTLENTDLNSAEITALTRRLVAENENVASMTVAFEPFGMVADKLYFAPYSYRTEDGVSSGMLGSEDDRYFYQDWYLLPRELAHPVWTEPYYGQVGGQTTMMTTYAVPFYRIVDRRRQFTGVVTMSISLDWIRNMVTSIRLYKTGYSVVTSSYGTYIVHPLEKLVLNETVFSLSEALGDPEIWDIARNMADGKTGFMQRGAVRDGKESFLFYMPLPIGGWSLAFLFPVEEVLSEVTILTRNMLIIGIIGFCMLAGAVVWIAGRITRPVRELSGVALTIAEGDLDAQVPDVQTRDELSDLAHSFEVMQTSLKDHIRDLTETTAQKERIESELRIGHDIQMGILPKIFPAFPECKEFNIFASVEPAKEVGGDLYDFFFVDEHHFCFLIGDVSGKGVPAAFFMAVAKTLLKVVAERGVSAGAILEKVNNDLSEDNDSCMFVTLFVAIVDIRTGEVTYASAGHNPPVVLAGGKASYLPPLNEPIAGAMTGMEYTTKTLTLAPGETIFLYTDGVTEAMDPDDALYSDERLLEFMGGQVGKGVEEIVEAVNQSVLKFARGAEQSDDITMLAFMYMPQEKDKNKE